MPELSNKLQQNNKNYETIHLGTLLIGDVNLRNVESKEFDLNCHVKTTQKIHWRNEKVAAVTREYICQKVHSPSK